VKLTKLKK